MAWGDNSLGSLGDGGSLERADLPVAVSGIGEVTAIAAGGEHALALLKTGKVMAWGDNEWGQLGNGTHTGPEICAQPESRHACAKTPVPVKHLSHVVAIAAGRHFSLALLRNHKVMAWGDNSGGQLGDGKGGSGTNRDLPTLVKPLTNAGVTAIAAGGFQSLALLGDRTVMAWGANDNGQLGDGTNTGPEHCTEGTSYTICGKQPRPVGGLSGVSVITSGGYHSLALIPATG
jgi:alpha-tubulin suppressor-like RCC1 family protein